MRSDSGKPLLSSISEPVYQTPSPTHSVPFSSSSQSSLTSASHQAIVSILPKISVDQLKSLSTAIQHSNVEIVSFETVNSIIQEINEVRQQIKILSEKEESLLKSLFARISKVTSGIPVKPQPTTTTIELVQSSSLNSNIENVSDNKMVPSKETTTPHDENLSISTLNHPNKMDSGPAVKKRKVGPASKTGRPLNIVAKKPDASTMVDAKSNIVSSNVRRSQPTKVVPKKKISGYACGNSNAAMPIRVPQSSTPQNATISVSHAKPVISNSINSQQQSPAARPDPNPDDNSDSDDDNFNIFDDVKKIFPEPENVIVKKEKIT